MRGVRHVIGAFDRKVWGGALVSVGLLAVVAAAALVGWLLSTVDSQRGFARFDESAAEWGADHATDASTTVLRAITHLGGTLALIPVMAAVGLVAAYRHRRHDHPERDWGIGLAFCHTIMLRTSQPSACSARARRCGTRQRLPGGMPGAWNQFPPRGPQTLAPASSHCSP